MSLCTTCALLICAVIAALFVGAFLSSDVTALISLIFVGARLALFLVLVNFLNLRIGPH